MAMFLYSAAMSLDGFIAGPGGDMTWLTNDLGPNPLVAVLITQVGRYSSQPNSRRRRPL
jgi:dihydrofolate reductase